MRAVRALTGVSASPDQPWLPGLPHALTAVATAILFGAQACVTGLLLATLASFVVYLPLTALALNGGRAITTDAQVPALRLPAQILLLALWMLTVWGVAALGR
jgi:hypothetical protein